MDLNKLYDRLKGVQNTMAVASDQIDLFIDQVPDSESVLDTLAALQGVGTKVTDFDLHNALCAFLEGEGE